MAGKPGRRRVSSRKSSTSADARGLHRDVRQRVRVRDGEAAQEGAGAFTWMTISDGAASSAALASLFRSTWILRLDPAAGDGDPAAAAGPVGKPDDRRPMTSLPWAPTPELQSVTAPVPASANGKASSPLAPASESSPTSPHGQPCGFRQRRRCGRRLSRPLNNVIGSAYADRLTGNGDGGNAPCGGNALCGGSGDDAPDAVPATTPGAADWQRYRRRQGRRRCRRRQPEGIELVVGSAYADTLTGAGRGETLIGGAAGIFRVFRSAGRVQLRRHAVWRRKRQGHRYLYRRQRRRGRWTIRFSRGVPPTTGPARSPDTHLPDERRSVPFEDGLHGLAGTDGSGLECTPVTDSVTEPREDDSVEGWRRQPRQRTRRPAAAPFAARAAFGWVISAGSAEIMVVPRRLDPYRPASRAGHRRPRACRP